MSYTFSAVDTMIILMYLVTTLGIGFYFARKSDKDSTEYFLAGRKIGWIAVGLSIFATNISSEHFIGLAGSGASRGLAVGQFELMAVFILIFLGWFLAPVFIRSKVFTTPEFLGKRFDERTRKFFALLSIGIYILTKVTVTLFAAGLLFHKIFGINIYSSGIFIVLITGLYTLIGGAKSVIRTNVFQGVVLIVGAVLLSTFSLIKVGGFTGLTEKLPADYFQMFKSISDPDIPWTGIIFGAPILAFWYWCTDQYIVQRLLSAKGIDEARRGSLLAAILKILPIFILVLPGLSAAAIFPQVSGDDAYALLLTGDIVPTGVKGIVIAGVLAAIMSSLASVFNVTAHLFTNDLYKVNRPKASERELVLVGRLSTLVMILLAILCIPIIKMIDNQVYIYLQGMQAYLSPPIAAVFIFGIFSKRVGSKPIFWALIIGEGIGLSRLILDSLVRNKIITSQLLVDLSGINFLHQAIILFAVSCTIIYTVHLWEKYKNHSQAEYGTEIKSAFILDTAFDGIGKALTQKPSRTNILMSGLIVIIIIGIWTIWY